MRLCSDADKPKHQHSIYAQAVHHSCPPDSLLRLLRSVNGTQSVCVIQVMLLLFLSIGSLLVGAFLTYHISLIIRGMTSYETFKWQDYRDHCRELAEEARYVALCHEVLCCQLSPLALCSYHVPRDAELISLAPSNMFSIFCGVYAGVLLNTPFLGCRGKRPTSSKWRFWSQWAEKRRFRRKAHAGLATNTYSNGVWQNAQEVLFPVHCNSSTKGD